MEKVPLLPCSRTTRTPLFSLPEIDEMSPFLLPDELKEILIYGAQPSPEDPTKHTQSKANDRRSWIKFKTTLQRSNTAPAIFSTQDFTVRQKPKSSSHLIRRHAHAIILVSVYLSMGVITYWFSRDMFDSSETHPVVDAFYFCIVTMCTIGYGDITPNSTTTKLFSILFVLVGFCFVDILLTRIVTYVLDLQEHYLLKAARNRSYIVDSQKGRMRIRLKVSLALGVVVLCVAVGASFLHYVEKLGWLDSVYLSVMSVTTVGYGDQAFTSLSGRIFASIWLLVSTLSVTRACLYLAEARVHRRQRRLTKLVLGQDMTVSEFLAADLDRNGSVRYFFQCLVIRFCSVVIFVVVFSKCEYLIYKLKEMGKVSEEEIVQILENFDRLDVGNCGKITLDNLMESCRSRG